MNRSKIFSLLCLLTLFLVIPHPAQSMRLIADSTSTSDWSQVNTSAFGLGGGTDGTYSGEEAKEIVVFNNQLYLGMEADNSYGARVWRTKAGVTEPTSQDDWEEVAADSQGRPFGISDLAQNDHIDSLAEFNNTLYVSTGNRGSGGQNTAGTLLYRSASGDAGSWGSPVTSAGFGDTHNENFKDMVVFQGFLCGGTWNQTSGAQVWCSHDGSNWEKKNNGGFGASADNPYNFIIVHSQVFQDKLYFGLENSGADGVRNENDVAKIYRTANIDVDTPSWEEVYSGSIGSISADLLGELNSYIYIAVTGSQGINILRSPSGDTGSWVQVNTSGMDGDANNTSTYNDSSVVVGGYLYVAVNNAVNGFEVWRTAGITQGSGPLIDWEQYGPNGWMDSHNIHAGLIPFNNLLYAWTTNYTSGQQVRRNAYPTAFFIDHELSEANIDADYLQPYFSSSEDHGLQPRSWDTITIRFAIDYANDTDRARLYYTTDGTNPEGSYGVGSGTTVALECSYEGSFGSPVSTDVAACTIYPLHESVFVNYILSAWNSTDGEEYFATQDTCLGCGAIDPTQANIFSFNVYGGTYIGLRGFDARSSSLFNWLDNYFSFIP